MIIGSRHKLTKITIEPEIRIGETAIKRVRNSKTLGVLIDEHLTWDKQLENVQTKVSRGIGMLRRMRKVVPKTTLIKVYNAIILPHFDYCSLVWDNCSDYLIDKLQKLQNRAARVITGRSYKTRSRDVLKELQWQPLKERFEHKKLLFMHKIRNNEFPNSILNMFKLKTNSHYNLRRNNRDFILDKPNTNFMKKSIYLAMLLPRPGIICHQRPKGQKLVARNLSLFSTITLQNDILFFKPFEGGWVILFHIFCNAMHVLFRIILLSYVVFMYVFTSVFKYCKTF